ncbi:hypothetical protein SLS57_002719 [Botryosphaeria dothidea]
MKVATFLLGSAIAVSTTVLAQKPDNEAVCDEPGQPCYALRRAADAAAFALAYAQPCQGSAHACALAKRDVEDFGLVLDELWANYTSTDGNSLDEFVKRAGGSGNYCHFRGSACPKKRAPEPEPEAKGTGNYCHFRGSACPKKRAPEPEPEPASRFYCRFRGSACPKKRAPEPEPEAKGTGNYCHFRGSACPKKRAPEPDPEPASRFYCRFRGSVCPKKRDLIETEEGPVDYKSLDFCHDEGQPCYRMKRAAEAIAEAVLTPEETANEKKEAAPVCTSCIQARRDLEELSKAADLFVAS